MKLRKLIPFAISFVRCVRVNATISFTVPYAPACCNLAGASADRRHFTVISARNRPGYRQLLLLAIGKQVTPTL